MSAAQFQIGPLTTVITPDELEAWLAGAEPKDRLVYASGLAAPKGDATFALAQQMADDGLVLTLQSPRQDGRGKDYMVQRRAADIAAPRAPAPAPADPNAEESEEEAVLRAVRGCIRLGLPMRTDTELARQLTLSGADRASYLLRKLKLAGQIRIESKGPRMRRIVTIVATGRSTIEGAL